ncbi:anti-sigma-F factor Fin [Sediminibacillus sp. JSM 1682029]|uniref:anti-sigma-F factor Fin n=1 Tax=Sediminibacillus sp. JSM 1682029 TaxID=3229857 RepID=UPI0035236870
MSLVYQCKHCGNEVGKLNQQELDEQQLGFDTLSQDEKREMIQYQANGDVHIKTICENCQASLEQHPHYHELDHFLQ